MYTYPSMYEVPSTGLRCQRSHKSVVLVILHVQCHHVMPSVIALQVLTETVNSLDLSKRPFVVKTEDREMEADTVIIATGAVAKRMTFKGSGEGKGGFWNKGISACAVRVLWSARARGGGEDLLTGEGGVTQSCSCELQPGSPVSAPIHVCELMICYSQRWCWRSAAAV